MQFRLDKSTARFVNSKNAGNDFPYWQSRPIGERLAALELLRQQFYNYTDESAPRLQRVYSVTQQTRR
jgi:hypothetical protein